MTRLYSLLTVLSLLAFLSCKQKDSQVYIENLKCEYLVNPVGLDTETPRFTWQIRSENQGDMQKACKIVIGTDLKNGKNEKGIVWNSEVIKSNTIPVIYNRHERFSNLNLASKDYSQEELVAEMGAACIFRLKVYTPFR